MTNASHDEDLKDQEFDGLYGGGGNLRRVLEGNSRSSEMHRKVD